MAVVDEIGGEARYVVREARQEWTCCPQFGYGSGRRVCEAASGQGGKSPIDPFSPLIEILEFKIDG